MNTLNNIIEIELFQIGQYSLTVGMLATILIIIILTKLVLLTLRKILFRNKNIKKYLLQMLRLLSVHQ